MRYFIMGTVTLASVSVLAAQGPISGGGGGPAVYQAIAVAQLMSDVSTDMLVAQKAFPISGAVLKSIEFLRAERNAQYPNGRSIYRVQNSGGCSIEVEAIASDDSGMVYSTIWGELKCPSMQPCTGWGGDAPPPQCSGH